MDVGFETVGNATLICHDGGPVLVTDPWLEGPAYFGSWTLSHRIPGEQLAAIQACPYVWISHGHPDHLSGPSLERLKSKQLLVPDHVGVRIRDDLTAQGFNVAVLEDRQWYRLSPRLRVLCIADYNQDAVLLVELDGRLIANLNDAGDRGWAGTVRRIIRGYPVAYLMALSGHGDADMMNFFREDGTRIPPDASLQAPVGSSIALRTEYFGARYFIPFSSMHRYQRTDSDWANAYVTTLDDYARGFASSRCELLPAFVRVDFGRDEVVPLSPERNDAPLQPPEAFGDVWSDPLEADEVREVEQYFRAIEHLPKVMGFVNLRVGGRDNIVPLRAHGFGRGITFEVPRGSLMTAVRYRVFDDLLIGNFMKTTMHGRWLRNRLTHDFS
ncbi:MAG: MBL fold metallo-hydrolase, partial [Myxococcales bacterium]